METQVLSKNTRNKVLIFIVVLIIIDTILLILSKTTSDATTYYYNDAEPAANEISVTIMWFLPIFIGIPFLGFIIGSIVSIIPYKEIPYSKKYIPFSLVTILALYAFIFIRGLINLFI